MVEDFARSVDIETARSEQGSTFTKADAMHFNLVLGRGTGDPEAEGSDNLPNLAMLLPLHYRTMRLEPHHFRGNGRSFFGLPAHRAQDHGVAATHDAGAVSLLRDAPRLQGQGGFAQLGFFNVFHCLFFLC